MTWRRVILGVVILVLAGALFLAYWVTGAPIDEAALARRVAESVPQWANYQEDIKGQIGARAVAQWRGRPVSAEWIGAMLDVEFELSGPWAGRDVALPILCHTPSGKFLRSGEAMRNGEIVRYSFPAGDEESMLRPAWVELKYPHEERRIAFDEKGRWQAGDAGR